MDKSREIWIHDYFTNLQMEYLSYYARHKLYDRVFDKKMFADICRLKQKKIEKIAWRNDLSSIFKSLNTWDKYLDKWMRNGKDLPSFKYRDDDQQYKYWYWDCFHYFHVGTKVIYDGKECAITKNYIRSQELIIKVDNEDLCVSYPKVYGRGYQIMKLTDEGLLKLSRLR